MGRLSTIMGLHSWRLHVLVFRAYTIAFAGLCVLASLMRAQEPSRSKDTHTEPADAAEVRQQLALVEKLAKVVPDRGAIFYFRAVAAQHLGNTPEALRLLAQCVDLREGFDPEGEREFQPLRQMKEFQQLVEKVHHDFPPITGAHVVYESPEKDLVPEGLEYDSRQSVFYMSSLNRRKIVKIVAGSGAFSDFVQADSLHGKPLLPVLGIRMDPRNGSVWANGATDRGESELMHFSPAGALLGRYSLNDGAKHLFNDLVLRSNGEVILTDSLDNRVWRFDANSKTFAPVALYRELFYPNGIALADDGRQLFVADALGIVRVDLANDSSSEVDPGLHNTVSQADGLYWHKGALVAIQNGVGWPRVAEFRLSQDGLHVVQTMVLEYRSALMTLPTTGAIRGDDFYFMTNTQLDNLKDDKVLDPGLLERTKIAVVDLRS